MPRYLHPGRYDRVVDPPPGRSRAPDGALGIDVGAEGDRHQGEVAVERSEVQVRDPLGALVRQRPDVEVLAVAALSNQLDSDVAEVVSGVWDVQQHDSATLKQALVVLPQSEDEHLPFFFAPVPANSLEYRRSVV